MKNIFITFTLLLWSSLAFSVCSSPISRSNAAVRTELTATAYNLDLNTVYTRANELPGDCITDETVTSAKILAGTIVNSDISTSAAIASSKVAAANYAIAASDTSTYTTTSATYVDVTNATVTFTTTGKPVEVRLINGSVNCFALGATTRKSTFKVVRDSTDLPGEYLITNAAGTTADIGIPGSAFTWFDVAPSAGPHTYKLQVKSDSTSVTTSVTSVKIFVREL